MLRIFLIPFLALFLVMTFLAHDAHAEHDHPHTLFGGEPASPLHGDNRKMLLIALLCGLFMLVQTTRARMTLSLYFLRHSINCFVVLVRVARHDLLIFFQRGILHTKVW
ncbi:MAG: hypothetical protein AAB367_04155 [Patescibacteria group bacterium]